MTREAIHDRSGICLVLRENPRQRPWMGNMRRRIECVEEYLELRNCHAGGQGGFLQWGFDFRHECVNITSLILMLMLILILILSSVNTSVRISKLKPIYNITEAPLSHLKLTIYCYYLCSTLRIFQFSIVFCETESNCGPYIAVGYRIFSLSVSLLPTYFPSHSPPLAYSLSCLPYSIPPYLFLLYLF